MSAELWAVRVDGYGADVLTLHTTARQADTAVRAAVAEVLTDRFGYAPSIELRTLALIERAEKEGYRVRVEVVPVEP